MDDSDEVNMDKRLGRIAGFLAFVLVVARLGRLMETGDPAPAWHVVLMASAFLGGVIWWLISQTVSRKPLAIALFGFAGIILFLRISVPDSLYLGFLPTPETIDRLNEVLSSSIETIRFGLAPVIPDVGVVAILAVLMWIIGGLFMWGSTSGPVLAMIIPSFALYLQLAVMDRTTTGLIWMIGSAGVIALGIVAVAMERRVETGRVRDSEGRPIARQTQMAALGLAAIIGVGAIATATNAAGLVPARGNLRWRSGSGYGVGDSGIRFDRLADLQQRIINRSNQVLFTAALNEGVDPTGIYWRMETLDVFDGEAWRPSGRVVDTGADDGLTGGDPAHAYQGTTEAIAARVRMAALDMNILPTPGIAEAIDPTLINTSALQVGSDGALVYGPGLGQDDEYVIDRAILPLYSADIAALATDPEDGELTDLFASAVADGEYQVEPDVRTLSTERPADLDRFLELPEDRPLAILAEAGNRTDGAETDFERAWLLQYWFRDSGDFTYSTNVSTGNGTLDLEAWLTDEDSINYHVGYCEQFAAAMAVMGRELGIPSRVVWGFTPGTVEAGNQIQVRDTNAHAWVEMWMDGFGWVQFDPTPRGGGVIPTSFTAEFDPTLYVEAPDVPSPIEGPPDEFIPPGLTPGDLGSGSAETGNSSFPWELLGVVLLIAAAAFSIPVAKRIRRNRRLARIRKGDITAAWDEIVDRLTDLGQPVPNSETPMEFASRNDDSLVSLATRYSAAVYGGRNGSANEHDLEVAEGWIKRRYEGGQRARAVFNPRSLINRDRD